MYDAHHLFLMIICACLIPSVTAFPSTIGYMGVALWRYDKDDALSIVSRGCCTSVFGITSDDRCFGIRTVVFSKSFGVSKVTFVVRVSQPSFAEHPSTKSCSFRICIQPLALPASILSTNSSSKESSESRQVTEKTHQSHDGCAYAALPVRERADD